MMEPDEADELFARACELIRIDRERDAVPLLLRVLAVYPDDTDVLCKLSLAHHQLKNYAEGLKFADNAVKCDPEDETAHRWRSYNLRAMRRYAEALDAAQEAVNLDPENAYCLDAMAIALLHCGRLKEAEDIARQLVELDPDCADSWVTLGLIYSNQKRYEEAEQCERKALEIDPQCSFALNNLAVTLERAGKIHDSLDLYYAALQAEPTNAEARQNLDDEVRKHGFDSLLDYLEARSDPGRMFHARRFRQQMEQAEAAIRQDQPGRAEVILLRALARQPNNLAALEMLARTRWNQGDLMAALRYARRMTQVAPDVGLGHWRVGTLLLAMHDNEGVDKAAIARDVMTAANEATRCAPDDPDNLLLLAHAQCLCKHLTDAEQTAKKLLALRPTWNQAAAVMGDVYRHQQHFRVAEMYYQKACDLDTSDAALINAVGLALWQMDRRDQARACFDRAHELKPDVVAYRLNRARYSPWQISRWFDVFSK